MDTQKTAREAWDNYADIVRLQTRHPGLSDDAEYRAVLTKLHARFELEFLSK